MSTVVRLTPQLWAEVMRSLKAGRKVRPNKEQRWQAGVDALVIANMPAAEKIARNIWRRYTRQGQGGYSSQIDIEDMVSCASIGLVEAARRYDPTDGAFLRFAYLRIRGAILERYRRNAYRDMQHGSIDDAATEEIEGMHAESRNTLAIVEALTDPGPLPDEAAARLERRRLAGRAIHALPDDERDILMSALAGSSVGEISAERGISIAWGRAKLAAARDKVAAAATGAISPIPPQRRDWRDEVKKRIAA